MGLFSKKSKPSQSVAQGYAPPPGAPPQQYGAPQQQAQGYSGGGGGYSQQPQYPQGGYGGYQGAGGQQYAPPPTAPPPAQQQSVGGRGREDPLAALSKYDTVFLGTFFCPSHNTLPRLFGANPPLLESHSVVDDSGSMEMFWEDQLAPALGSVINQAAKYDVSTVRELFGEVWARGSFHRSLHEQGSDLDPA